MKTILTTLNAKYIHTSLALRLLYVANKEKHTISFREFTIKEKIETVVEELLKDAPNVIGLGVYIWNVEQTRQLIALLKQERPEVLIVLGGPEVTYEPQYFIENWNVDYVISGEGEFVLGELLSQLKAKSTNIKIASVSSKLTKATSIAKADIIALETLESPYSLSVDKEEMRNKIMYFESSRGCPYQCQYCLSSLEKGVRYFSQDYILDNLDYLMKNGVKTIKFLDRTFNLNKKHTDTIFNFMIANYRQELSCQFEIYADLLNNETINYLNETLPKNYFRFEIGIQSTYIPTNEAVRRKQDFDLLRNNILKIMNGNKIDLHLDLIAGLPYETFDRFVKSFNDVFEMKAKEVQLGFLKMLRGTGLRKNAHLYGYIYDEQAPYQITSNNAISNTELERIHRAEHILEKYWNSGKFKLSMSEIFNTIYPGKYFEFFNDLADYYETENISQNKLRLEDLFWNLHTFTIRKGYNLFELLRTDYYNNFTIRAHGFWESPLSKKEKKQLLYQIANDKVFLGQHNLTRKIVEKQISIDPLHKEGEYLLTLFDEKQCIEDKHKEFVYSF